MSDGFGAGFFTITLLAVLVGLAGLLALAAAGNYLLARRTGAVPRPVRYLPIALLAAVVAVAGFGVLALYDEALPGAGLVVALVLLPLVAGGLSVRRARDAEWGDVAGTVALAWCLPFLAGVATFVALVAGLTAVLGLAPAESGRRLVVWVAIAGSGLVVVGGTLALVGRVGRVALDASRS